MINIIIMVHLQANQYMYSQIFARMPDVRFIVIPVDGPDIDSHKEQIETGLQQLSIQKDDLDFVFLSTNYGSKASEEINKPAIDYFLNEFRNANIIGTGTTPASITKALALSDRIYAMKHSLNEAETLSFPLSNKLISVSCLRELVEQRKALKQNGYIANNRSNIKSFLAP